nr:thiamine phosphate synthase [Methanosarcina horonobensis]
MIDEASEIKRICGDRAIFLVNDRIDVALAVDADGVHIGQDDMPIETARKLLGADKIIGLTVHNVDEAVEAEKKGADYVGLGSIFDTSTKKRCRKGNRACKNKRS